MNKIAVILDGHTFEVEFARSPRVDAEFAVRVNGETALVHVPEAGRPVDEIEWVVVDGRPYELAFDADLHWIRAFSGLHQLEVRDLRVTLTRPVSGDGRVKAPIPGQITRVAVAVGQMVEAGDPLMVLEAMKMENEIRAPRAGRVDAVHVAAGQGVSLGQVLAEIV